MKFSKSALTIFNDFVYSNSTTFGFLQPFINYFSNVFGNKDFDEYLVPKTLSLEAEEYAYLMLALEWTSIVSPNNADSLARNMQHYFSGIRLDSTKSNAFLFDGELFIFLILYLLLDNYRTSSCCDSFVLERINAICDKIGILVFSKYISKVNAYGVDNACSFIFELNNGIYFKIVSFNEKQTAITNKETIVYFPGESQDCLIPISTFLSHYFKLPII